MGSTQQDTEAASRRRARRGARSGDAPDTEASETPAGAGSVPGPGSESGLVVDAIDVHYGKIQALRNVSLRIAPGEMVALLGANGAGKSTTLKAISGLVEPSKGKIWFEGRDLTGQPAYDVVGHGIAHLPEGRELFPTLTVEENLRFGYYSKLKTDKKGYKDQLERIFDLFPRLRERRDQAAGTMSGGEQQMLGAARAMMSKPKLLIVDELSMGLAPQIVTILFNALHDVNREGTSVLIVEQFIHLALENTKRAYALAKGEVVLQGKSKDLADDPELIEAYLGGEGDAEKSGGGKAGDADRDPVATKARKSPKSRAEKRPRTRANNEGAARKTGEAGRPRG